MAAKIKQPATSPPPAESDRYLVVARRYRPQAFVDLVGQSHVSTALTNAIQQNRVGHAYLFSGARGTGKTSTARIFAKCLNCVKGPTTTPCQECDVCQGITSGDDIDVLEIDGASNRRIEEIRQLRSTVNIRPSRARFKIYIIDEVHMLTKEAFNALLKTLEEPPEHVKFIFCTTELDKIPITIRSRCQLFEFTPVAEQAIRSRLAQIATTEKVAIADDALTMLARRAAGSMRDSQSLLEQLLSLGKSEIALSDVNQLLGTADSALVGQLAEQITARQTADALATAHSAFRQGVDAGQLTSQLLGFYRDCLAASVGCADELLRHVSPDQTAQVRALGKQIGAEQALAIAQILDECLVKMRASTHPQVQLELALVRMCRLEQLQSLSDLIEQLGQSPADARSPQPLGSVPARTPAKFARAAPPPAKKNDPAETGSVSTANSPVVAPPSSPRNAPPAAIAPDENFKLKEPSSSETEHARVSSVSSDNVESIWKQALHDMADTTADMASQYKHLEWSPDGRLTVTLPEPLIGFCSRPDPKSRIEKTLEKVAGQKIAVHFVASSHPSAPPPAAQTVSKRKLMQDAARDPLVKAAIELFDAAVVDATSSKNERS